MFGVVWYWIAAVGILAWISGALSVVGVFMLYINRKRSAFHRVASEMQGQTRILRHDNPQTKG